MIVPPDTHNDRLNARAWWLLLAGCVVVLLWLLHAELLLTPTIPASHDMTGHLVPIAELERRLLPALRLHGWSAGWFAGFPLFYFYFPLPALLAASLAPVAGLTAALKLTSVAGLLAFPFAVYALLRACRASRAHAAIATAVAAAFLLQSFWFLGGNIASTVAGEFSYSISFALSLCYLAVLLRSSGRAGGVLAAAALLAAVALSHLVTTIVVVLISAVLLLQAEKRRLVLLSWVVGFLLSAFWTLPFLLRRGELAAVYTGAPRNFAEAMPLELWAVLPAAIVALFFLWRKASLRPLLFVTAAGLALYLLLGDVVYPGRFLPYWFLGLHMWAGMAVAGLLLTRQRRAIAFAVALLLPIVLVQAVRGTGWLRQASAATYAGLENGPAWPEVRALIEQLQKDSGAVYWEDAPLQLSSLGSRHLGAVTPYLAPDVRVLNGLWIESTQLHDELLDIARTVGAAPQMAPPEGEREMRAVLATLSDLGVSQFVALNYATAELLARVGATPVHASPHVALFRFGAAPRIEVEEGASSAVQISEWSAERIRFRTQAIGAAHLVRMSYFPNWRADGATIERGRHSLMVVTPTGSEVVLRFAPTWVERTGAFTSLATLVAAIAVALLLRRRHPG